MRILLMMCIVVVLMSGTAGAVDFTVTIQPANLAEAMENMLAYCPKPPTSTDTDVQHIRRCIRDIVNQALAEGKAVRVKTQPACVPSGGEDAE